MRTKLSIGAVASLVVGLLAGTVNAQYLTSTKAGFVNYVTGKAYILRADSEDGEKGRASLGTQMQNGDTLSTNAGGFAEILLNPGSYIRLSENSEIIARNTSFTEVRFEIVRGSAILEIGQIDKKEPIEILTPRGAFTIPKDGIYRVDVKNDQALVSVRQGEIYLGSIETGDVRASQKFGRGKAVTLNGSASASLAKIDKDASDAFDTWAFNRANSVSNANLVALRSNRNGNAFNGGWYYNSYLNYYTFMPFRGQWFSPYGFGFFNSWANGYWYNPYGYGYGSGYGSGRPTGGGGVVAGLPGRVLTGADRAPIRRSQEARTVDSGFGNRGDFGGRGVDSGSFSRGSSAPSVISAPAPERTISAPAPSGGGGGGRGMPSRN